MTVRLGPFQLHAPLDAGGMASIWSGQHLESGTPVAAKLIPPGELTDTSRTALQREIQTAASLDHPGIVWIVDQGTISPSASRESGGRIEEGAPYLMMEFCSHTLGSLLPLTTWGELRTILASLLDALAYAHARGVIHRDLKPGNVLFGGPDDLRPGLKIADFGIAHALDTPDPVTGTRKLVGTPRYMSPEQVEGDPRLLGPGTDLYALAALTFKCLHGHGPFRSSGARLLFDHLRTPAPPLQVPSGFPKELAEWVDWLLQKDVNARPASAAAALHALPDGPLYPLVAPEIDDEEASTVPLATARLNTLPLRRMGPRRPRFLPVPKTWRATRPYGGSPRLRDVGRSLLGLRPIPLAGRQQIRDLLWTAFRQSANRGTCISVLLDAQEGLGRTRLVSWFTQRVKELGCGRVLKITGQPRQQRGPTLRRLLAGVFRTGNATGDERSLRIDLAHERLGLEPGPLIGFAMRPNADTDVIAAATAQLFERLAGQGPLVICVDDVQLVPALCRDLNTWKLIDGPICILATAREESLPGPELRDLSTWATFQHTLSPLQPTERQHLIDSILPLSPSLSALVDRRTDGNPRFAIQLLTDWVQRGVLLPGPTGFEAPRDLQLPRSLQAIWSSRIRHLLSGFGPEAGPVLEIAAMLGNEVIHDELRTLLPDAASLWHGLIARMALHRLITPGPDGFVFSHPAIREVLVDRARRGDRLIDHHGAIAALLSSRDDPETRARRGLHRAGAGDTEGAITDLFAAAQYYRSQADFQRTLILCDQIDGLLTSGDPRQITLKVLRARTLNSAHHHAAGRQEAESAMELAEAKGWTAEAAAARLQYAIGVYHTGDYARSRHHLERTLDDLPSAAHETRALALNHIAWTHVLEEHIERALPLFTASAKAHFERGDEGRLDGLMILADQANFKEDFDEVERLLDEAWALASDPPRLLVQPYLLERKVYLGLSRHDHEAARDAALDLVDLPGLGPKTSRARSLLGSTQLRCGEIGDAHQQFLRCSCTQMLPESPLERSMIYAGLLGTAPNTTPPNQLETWTHALEVSIPDPPARHPNARYLIERAVERLPPLLAYRCEQLLLDD